MENLKHIKTFENKYTDKYKKSNKIIDLWKSYGLIIGDIVKGKFVYRFPDREPFNETSNTEYRIKLIKIHTLKEFTTNWG